MQIIVVQRQPRWFGWRFDYQQCVCCEASACELIAGRVTLRESRCVDCGARVSSYTVAGPSHELPRRLAIALRDDGHHGLTQFFTGWERRQLKVHDFWTA